MAIKYPLEYELTPDTIDTGRRWMTLSLKNIGTEDMTGLDVKVNSLDAYSIGVLGTGSYIARLGANEEREVPFQVSASRTGSLYVTLDGWKDGERFHWESPGIPITVGKEVAELSSLFAMTEPYSLIGEKIRCEATVRGLTESEGLKLEFWADTPGGAFEELAIVETKPLSVAEEATYSAEITPDEEGLYTIYAYLYDGVRRIGREVEYVYVREA
jgi:hypothetical protein